MGIYNFQMRFRRPIRLKIKNHTIRAKQKHRAKPGEVLHLYTGLRTKRAKLIKRVICTRVEDIAINGHGMIFVDGESLLADERQELAKKDGFESHIEMMAFWKGRLPFSGDIIHWRDLTATERRMLRRNRKHSKCARTRLRSTRKAEKSTNV